MSKNLKIGLIVVAVAIAAYFIWRWWQNRQSSVQSPAQASGSNLSSVAPELVGGSAGPSVGSAPAVSLPVSITLTEPTHSDVDLDHRDMEPQAVGAARTSANPTQRQRRASGVTSVPNPEIPSQDESAGTRGMSDTEQDKIEQPDASMVGA